MLLLILFAALAGVATVLSPCILPVLPAILSASATGGKGRPFGVILGLLASFIFFTLALTTLVQSIGLSANVLRYLAIGLIGFFGLILLLPALSDWFATWTGSIASLGAELQSRTRSYKSGFGSGLLIGAALGLVWTPCAGPILAAITTLVATQQVTLQVILITVAYSLGAGLPLLLIAYGGQRAVTTFPFLARHAEGIRQVFGTLMILTALALAFNWDVAFQQKVLDYLPSIQLENNAWVQKELQELRGPSPYAVQEAQEGKLPYIAPAPQLKGITTWINSAPLSLDQLKGKVVLVDFWTYSCINCIRTFPYLRRWNDAYKDKGLVIIGVHTPEFEKDTNNVKKATERFQITYPVALDNQYQTWQAFYNSYWPAHYLIDQQGIVRQVHFGEGKYGETENAIRSLLNLPLLAVDELKTEESTGEAAMTPETYLGYKRASAYTIQNRLMHDQKASYEYTASLLPNQVGLKGEWTVEAEFIQSDSDESTLSLNFEANRVYLVLGGKSAEPIRVELDGQPLSQQFWTVDMDTQGTIFVKDARKYDMVDLKGQKRRHVITLHIPKGIQAYAFTFGMEE